MPTPIKFDLVCLTREAINNFSDNFMSHYIYWDKYIICTKFFANIPFSQLTAVPNEENQDQDSEEFLIPNHYVTWIAVDQDEKVLGFVKPLKHQ